MWKQIIQSQNQNQPIFKKRLCKSCVNTKMSNMKRHLCHLEMQTRLWHACKNNQHHVLLYSAHHTETVPCGNAMYKRHCFLVSVVKRRLHNKRQNHHSISLHPVQLPYRKTVRRVYMIHNLTKKACHITSKCNGHFCSAALADLYFWKVHTDILPPQNVISHCTSDYGHNYYTQAVPSWISSCTIFKVFLFTKM